MIPTLALVGMACVLTAEPASAQRMGIVATVNSTPISEYDLNARIELVIMLSGTPRTRENFHRIAPSAIETLIDEELKRQEAKNLRIEITQEEVDRTRRAFEKLRNMPEGGIYDAMEKVGVSKDVIDQQITVDLGWSRALRLRFRALTEISDEEVDTEIARLDANKGKPIALLSEIFLPVDTPAKDTEARQTADRIARELAKGVGFPALAATFSQSASAAVGGDLGWVPTGMLTRNAQQAIAAIKPGQISKPIRTPAGYTIYWFRDQRISQGATGPAADPKIVLQQVFIPISQQPESHEEADKVSLAKRLALRADSCDAMARFPRMVAGGVKSNRNELQMSQLAPRVRDTIKNLPDGQVSEPLKVPGAVMLFMICSRQKADSAQELRSRIRERLIDERLSLASRQYLRDLRRNAFTERRR
ncbi:MAG: peptidylprolyl isomerase [Rhodospirillaceae bacterium]